MDTDTSLGGKHLVSYSKNKYSHKNWKKVLVMNITLGQKNDFIFALATTVMLMKLTRDY